MTEIIWTDANTDTHYVCETQQIPTGHREVGDISGTVYASRVGGMITAVVYIPGATNVNSRHNNLTDAFAWVEDVIDEIIERGLV